MDEHINNLQTAYIKNLENKNFNSSFSVPIDANVNIKTILNTNCSMVAEKVECTNGKAIVSGKLHLKVTYLDTDNICTTLNESQSFSENITDQSLTNECFLDVLNNHTSCNVLSYDGVLKIETSTVISPILYLNLGFNTKVETNEKCVCKKSNINTKSISNYINTNFDYTTNFEIKDKVTKILCFESYFNQTDTTAEENTVTVEGKLYTKLIYETSFNDECEIKEICEMFNVKTDIAVDGISSGSELVLNFKAISHKDQTEIEIEDNASIVTITNQIYVCGVALKDVEIDTIEDIYCIDQELDLVKSSREYIVNIEKSSLNETIFNELTLQKDEPAIDDIISNLNINYEILNSYVKDSQVYFEGIIYSCLLFVDENKDYGKKSIECPFVINSKLNFDKIKNEKIDLSITDCKTKIKRGTIIEVEYSVQINYSQPSLFSKELVTNITYGKVVDNSMYDYQIFIAKPNETKWDICKRIKTYPDELIKLNPNAPDVFEGGEKIIIKR